MFDILKKQIPLSSRIFDGAVILDRKTKRSASVKLRRDAPLCHTWIIKGDYFNLEIRSPTMFDNMFKDWELLK